MDKETMLQPVDMPINVIQAMCIIGNIQLATRHHKNIGESRQIAEQFARELQNKIAPLIDSNHAAIIQMGWDPNFDIE